MADTAKRSISSNCSRLGLAAFAWFASHSNDVTVIAVAMHAASYAAQMELKSVVQLLLNVGLVLRNNVFSQEEWHLDKHSPSIVYECLDPEVLQEENQNSSDVL